MNPSRIFTVTRRVLGQLANDKRTLAMIFVAPLFAMTIFGLAFSEEIRDIPVVVVNEDEGFVNPLTNETTYISRLIIANIDGDALDVSYASGLARAIAMVEDGEARAVVHFPANFTRNIAMRALDPLYEGTAVISVRADQTNVNVAAAIFKEVGEAVSATMEEQGFEAPMKVDPSQAIYGQGMGFMDFFVPGILAFVVFLLTTVLTLITFVGERTSGTLDRMMASPLREEEIVLGYATAFTVVGTIQTCELLAFGIVVFDIPVEGNILLAFIIVALLASVSQALGIMLSALAKSEAQAIQFLPFIILPAFLLAGVFLPVEQIPSWLRPFSYMVPPYYAVDGYRAVMLRGWGLEKVWVDIAALVGFAVVFLTLATLSLRMRRR